MTHFNLASLRNELMELEQDMAQSAFWDDLERSTRVNQHAKTISDKLAHFKHLEQRVADVETMIELVDEENDPAMVPEVTMEIDALEEELQTLRLETLLRGEYDHNNAILSLHAGAGGTEAQDWTSMLYRMYVRYCERKHYQVRLMDMQEGD
ncbi:MAG: PCRF domain-containing protein, partial [Clostridia bacterium]